MQHAILSSRYLDSTLWPTAARREVNHFISLLCREHDHGNASPFHAITLNQRWWAVIAEISDALLKHCRDHRAGANNHMTKTDTRTLPLDLRNHTHG